jgi:hypothetical protein
LTVNWNKQYPSVSFIAPFNFFSTKPSQRNATKSTFSANVESKPLRRSGSTFVVGLHAELLNKIES